MVGPLLRGDLTFYQNFRACAPRSTHTAPPHDSTCTRIRRRATPFTRKSPGVLPLST